MLAGRGWKMCINTLPVLIILKLWALCKIEPRGNGWLSGVWGLIDHVDSSSVGG